MFRNNSEYVATNSGSSTLQNGSCTATYHPSHKPSWTNKDELINYILL